MHMPSGSVGESLNDINMEEFEGAALYIILENCQLLFVLTKKLSLKMELPLIFDPSMFVSKCPPRSLLWG